MFQHQVVQRPVDKAAHRLGFVLRGQIVAEQRGAGLWRRAIGGGAGALRGDQTGHHFGRGLQARAGNGLGRDSGNAGVGFAVDRQCACGVERPGLGQQAGEVQQRVARLVGFDLGTAEVGGRHVGPGVAVEPHHAEVEECWLAPAADEICGLCGDTIGLVEVEARGAEIGEARALGKAGGDPAIRGLGRDADAIVLADEQQGQRHRLVSGPARGVESGLRAGVVGRGIAERGHHDRVVGQLAEWRRAAAGEAQRVGGPHRLGQVAGDGRGLRRNVQRLRAQHLVPPARDRIPGAGGERQQHVPRRGLAGYLRGALDLEGGVAIVEEGHVLDPQRGGQRGHSFMARGADGVEALPRPLHHPRLPVERAAEAGRTVDRNRPRGRQRPGRRRAGREIRRRQPPLQLFMNNGCAVH